MSDVLAKITRNTPLIFTLIAVTSTQNIHFLKGEQSTSRSHIGEDRGGSHVEITFRHSHVLNKQSSTVYVALVRALRLI